MIKTNVIVPVYHSNSRTELRLDSNRVYAGNLRLGNISCKTTTNPQNKKLMYNSSSGVLSLIENMYLYDGNQLLDQLIGAHHLFAFRTLQKGNAFNFNKNQHLIGETNSFYIEQDPNGTEYSDHMRIDANPMGSFNFATSSTDDTLSGWLNLTAHFNFLKNMVYNVTESGQQVQKQFIDTNIFKNFRVVIEWRSASEIVSCFQGKTGDTPVSVEILGPRLFCDEAIGAKLPQQLAFQYNVYEVDTLIGNGTSAAAGGVISTKARLNGFNGKFVNKLLLMNINPEKLRDDTGTDGIKCDGSQAYLGEVLQLYVNGETLFDFNGIDSDARRLSFLFYSWGPMTLPLGSYGNMSQDLSKLLTQRVLDMKGRMSYTGCIINDRIVEFAVEHRRTTTAATPSFLMQIWAEIPKQIQVNNGAYNVAYS